MGINPSFPSTLSEEWKAFHASLLAKTYFRYFNEPLLKNAPPTFQNLFEFPFILLSHGIQADPVLNFGSRRALQLWELTWDELTQMPSRLTAEPMEREARSQFMETVRRQGFVENYEGIRVSKSGRRFKIQNAKVWNLIDPQNIHHGQAAYFETWTDL
ncbi:MAG: MEKHLA domain-containing protein [Verrucomicrobiota bacterium]